MVTLQLDQPLHDGESQAIAVAGAVRWNTDLIELVIDIGQLIGRHRFERHLTLQQRTLYVKRKALLAGPFRASTCSAGGDV